MTSLSLLAGRTVAIFCNPCPPSQVNVLLNNCKQNTTSLSLLAGRTVAIFVILVPPVKLMFYLTIVNKTHHCHSWLAGQ